MRPRIGGPAITVPLSPHLYRFTDSCQVYVLTSGREAVLVDIGTGDVLDHLAEFGVDRVTDVLLTHHHRDQAQGLPRAAAAGIRIWVPEAERDLFAGVEEFWQSRGIETSYNPRQDRFSLLASVPVHATLPEYRTATIGGFDVLTLPTPGHTTGSISLFVEVDGARVGFTGDLLYGPGQVWSLAALQWTYTGHGGIAATVLSLRDVLDQAPDCLMPSHGEPMNDPAGAVAATVPRLEDLLHLNRPWDLTAWRDEPFEQVTPHLLRNRTANAQSFVLLSESGTALLIDFGYDMITDWAAGEDRTSRRAWLPSLQVLRRDFGIERVEVAIPTHYHDDHVAGLNLLRAVQGTQVWAEAGIAEILADPRAFDLPCLYRDPIAVDRVVPTGTPLAWREYEVVLHPLPGHCRHAVAVQVDVDGVRALATGDQQVSGWVPGEQPEVLNYQYRNGFRPQDYVDGALLYQRLRPDHLLTGHWGVRRVDDAYLDHLLAQSRRLVELHEQLLARQDLDTGPGDMVATIAPYSATGRPGVPLAHRVQVRNPLHRHAPVTVRLTVPPGWECTPPEVELPLAGGETGVAVFAVRAPADARPRRRVVLAADVTVAGRRLGQVAECLVDLR